MLKFSTLFTLILLVVSSCKNEKEIESAIDYRGFSEKEVALVGISMPSGDPDTIGKLSIKIPQRLDTFYQWHRTSDCSSCGALQYRFADKKYIQFAEAGWIWTYIPDSVYQFTISHILPRDAPDSINLKHLIAKDTVLCEWEAHQLSGTDKIVYLKKEFREINGRGFVIAGFITPFGEITHDTTLYLTAITRLKKRTLNFTAECGAKDTTGFIENMYKSILSIKIEEQ